MLPLAAFPKFLEQPARETFPSNGGEAASLCGRGLGSNNGSSVFQQGGHTVHAMQDVS